MSQPENPSLPMPELAEFVEATESLRHSLMRQTNLFNHAIKIVVSSKDYTPPDNVKEGFSEEAREIIPIMIQGAGTSCHTLHKLSADIELQVRDCFPIARSIIETIINVCFILAEGDVAAKRARDHAFQKSYRDMDRVMRTHNWGVRLQREGQPDPSEIDGLEQALSQWNTRKGREQSKWTAESVEHRINVIGAKFGSNVERDLMVAAFSVYRHASEIIHGTYFGCLFFFGATQGYRRDADQARVAIANHLMLLLFAVVSANSALISVVSGTYGLEGTLGAASDKLMADLHDIPLFARSLADSSS